MTNPFKMVIKRKETSVNITIMDTVNIENDVDFDTQEE